MSIVSSRKPGKAPLIGESLSSLDVVDEVRSRSLDLKTSKFFHPPTKEAVWRAEDWVLLEEDFVEWVLLKRKKSDSMSDRLQSQKVFL